MTTFQKAIEGLEERGIMPETVPDLARMKEALTQVGFFDWPFYKTNSFDLKKIILVAGTNGKGSTCATLESLLRKAGQRTGFYSSPHLSHYCERIRIDGDPISEKLFTQAYCEIVEKTKNLPLTHFEVLTLMAIWVFASGQETPPSDYIILEVGLGGRWDATNAIPHGVSVFAPIDYDHQNLLGSTLREIGENKLDIVTPDSINVHQPFPPELSSLVTNVKKIKRGLWIESPSLSFSVSAGHPPQFILKTRWGDTEMALSGERGTQNTSLALTVFKALGFDPSRYLSAIKEVNWPARMQLIGRSKHGAVIYLSGDHNPHGIKSLISLLNFYPRKNLYILAAIGKDKDRDGILGPLFELPNAQVILTQTKFRFLTLEQYGPWLEKSSAHFTDSLEGFAWIQRRAEKDDMILVTGSLYLAGEFVSVGD